MSDLAPVTVAPITLDVDTPQGPGRWLLSPTQGNATALLLLGHGAGGGLDGVDLVALASLLPAHGVAVARFEQPWRVAGRKVATRPPTLDEAWLAAVPALLDDLGLDLAGVPVIQGGHSAGARVACRTAQAVDAVGVLALSFPLHPPGKPERSRLEELLTPSVPVLVLQGDRDPFGSAAELSAAVTASGAGEGINVVEVTGAGHPLAVPARVRPAAAHRQWLADQVLPALPAMLPPGNAPTASA